MRLCGVYLKKIGITFQKKNEICRYMLSKLAKHHGEYRVTVYDRVIQMWVLCNANIVRLEKFKVSDRFRAYFKQEYKLRSHKVTHGQAGRMLPDRFLQLIMCSFLSAVKENIIEKSYVFSSVRNTDQSGYTYEYVYKRTLYFQASKDVPFAVKIKQKTTSCYTIQITISAARNLVGQVFLINSNQRVNSGPKCKKKP